MIIKIGKTIYKFRNNSIYDDDLLIQVIEHFIGRSVVDVKEDNETKLAATLDPDSPEIIIGSEYGINGEYITIQDTGSKEEGEYRIIDEDDIIDRIKEEAEDVYDIDVWKTEVQNDMTKEGYYDWLEEKIDNADYGEFFARYDGEENSYGDKYFFRVN